MDSWRDDDDMMSAINPMERVTCRFRWNVGDYWESLWLIENGGVVVRVFLVCIC